MPMVSFRLFPKGCSTDLAPVFAETAQFGTEVITAFRTVTSLSIEDTITNRFDVLLGEHFQKAMKKARLLTTIFAFSDSAEMLSQALIFWYVAIHS
jgi:ATP-binding cassette, subfamily B (MDR/TAP), member 1